MESTQKKAFWCPVMIGLALIVAGLLIKMPGGALTTRSSLNGETTDYYKFDNRYSTIDEYVGGDAYNYIIGAALVSGKISGTMTVKAICIVSGVLCLCFGSTLWLLTVDIPTETDAKNDQPSQSLPESTNQAPVANGVEVPSDSSSETDQSQEQR